MIAWENPIKSCLRVSYYEYFMVRPQEVNAMPEVREGAYDPWSTAVKPDGTFKSADELRSIYLGGGGMLRMMADENMF